MGELLTKPEIKKIIENFTFYYISVIREQLYHNILISQRILIIWKQ